MKRILEVFLLFAIVLLGCPGAHAIEVALKTTSQVKSSLIESTSAEVVKVIGSARSEILVQAISFTSSPLAKALVDARKRGVHVEIILDRSSIRNRNSSADFMAHAGIATFIYAEHAASYNDIIVVDRETVIMGSLDFTKDGEKHAQKLTFFKTEGLAKMYADNWQKLKENTEVYKGRRR